MLYTCSDGASNNVPRLPFRCLFAPNGPQFFPKWSSGLRKRLREKVTAKVKRHNKFIALYNAQSYIRYWSRGGRIGDVGHLRRDFIGDEQIDLIMMT